MPTRKRTTKKNTKMDSFKNYLLSCNNNSEIFRFDTQEEADSFGQDIKIIAMKEEGVSAEFDLQSFDIKITSFTVRVCFLQPELMSV